MSLPSRRVEPDRQRAEKVVEMIGLVLLLVGMVGLVATAFAFDPLLGFAALSLAGIAVGAALTVRDV